MAKEVKMGLKAKKMMEQERAAITATIGEIFERKMRGAPVDAAALYKKVGGKSEFTKRLFAETFGTGKKKGIISSDPSVDTSIKEVNDALVKVAQKLAKAKVRNASGGITELALVNPRELAAAGDYICIKVGFVAGGLVPWPGDPFRGGPTTWAFGSPR